MRQAMAGLHTWSTVVPGWILYFMFLTGSTGYFAHVVDLWMRPELPLRSAVDPMQALVMAEAHLLQAAPHAAKWSIDLEDSSRSGIGLSWSDAAGERQSLRLYGPAGTVPPRATGGGHALYQLHWGLRYLPRALAYWIVGICAMAQLMALISGVIVHRRIFRDLFTFRSGKGARSWLDAHTLFGVISLPYCFMITYTGLVMMMTVYWPVLTNEIQHLDKASNDLYVRAFNQLDARDPEEFVTPPAGEAVPLVNISRLVAGTEQHRGALLYVSVLNPGDANSRVIVMRMPHAPLSRPDEQVFSGTTGRLLYGGAAPSPASDINEVLTGLHEAKYAGAVLRWVQFLSGLTGAAVIATGLVFWIAKRRQKYEGRAVPRWLSTAERFNTGIVGGLPPAIAAYFWANRLLPVTLPHRADCEMNALFLVWAVLLIYALTRVPSHSWIRLLRFTALAYVLLPVLNAATTTRHLGIALAYDHWRGDWGYAGFDLTVIMVGLAFAVLAQAAARVGRFTTPKHRRLQTLYSFAVRSP